MSNNYPTTFLCSPDHTEYYDDEDYSSIVEFRICPADAKYGDRSLWTQSGSNDNGYLIHVQVIDEIDLGIQLGTALLGATGTMLTLINYENIHWDGDQQFIDLILDQTASFMNDTFGSDGPARPQEGETVGTATPAQVKAA